MNTPEFQLKTNGDYIAITGSYNGESLNISVANGSVFDGATVKVFTGYLYNNEFDFVNRVVEEPTVIEEPTSFNYISSNKDGLNLYAILKLENATINTDILVQIGTKTNDNIKSFIQ